MGIATNMLDIAILKLQGYIFSKKKINKYRDIERKYPAIHNSGLMQNRNGLPPTTGLMQHRFAKNKKQKTLGFTT